MSFLRTSCLELKKRYDFDDSLLPILDILSPKTALSAEMRSIYPSILSLTSKLPRIAGDNEKYLQQLDDQWRKLPFVQFSSNINTEIEPDKFWAKLTKFKDSDSDEPEYYVISSFALKVLSLPHSNADCERLFSKINRVKTKSRNRLITKTVAATVLTSELISNSSTNGRYLCHFQTSKYYAESHDFLKVIS